MNKSNSSDVQSTLISLISRNITDFLDGEFILHSYQHLLTIPCPTVRVHTVVSFNNTATLLKSEKSLFVQLSRMFMNGIHMEAPYHSLLTSLKFFSIVLDSKFGYSVDSAERLFLSKCMSCLKNHSDADVISAASCVSRLLNSNEFCSENVESNCHGALESISLNELMDEISRIKGNLADFRVINPSPLCKFTQG